MTFKKGHMDLELPWKIKEPLKYELFDKWLLVSIIFQMTTSNVCLFQMINFLFQSPLLQENMKTRKYDKYKNNKSIMTITCLKWL